MVEVVEEHPEDEDHPCNRFCHEIDYDEAQELALAYGEASEAIAASLNLGEEWPTHPIHELIMSKTYFAAAMHHIYALGTRHGFAECSRTVPGAKQEPVH